MYWLMSVDALIRIALAIVLLFVMVPLLAHLKRRSETALEGFFWNFGVGIALITLLGQVFALANLFSLVTLILCACLIILAGRAAEREMPPVALARHSAEKSFLAVLSLFDRRINIRRRLRRRYRRWLARTRERNASPEARWQIAGWSALTLVAAGLRLYRPFASANLGFSDSYVHLYLLKLLDEGRQVDPEWGPYPRGMHFLLLAIHRLTNVDQILLMNFFGAVAGVLITLAVADTARRLTRSVAAGLVSGFLFATLIGGPGQYFILGGAFSTNDPGSAAISLSLPYRELASGGEFDLALTAFQRQTTTLSQELAIALLFPAAMFLLDFFRRRQRWHLVGYAGCTAAIAAVHSGVVVPLVVMAALLAVAMAIEKTLEKAAFSRAVITGMLAVIAGSSWALAFIAYPYTGGAGGTASANSVKTAVLYYFPFVRSLGPAAEAQKAVAGARVFVGYTPFLIGCALLAIALIVLAWRHRNERRGNVIWTSMLFLTFLTMHFASTLRLPEVVETTRNSQWLLMSLAVLLGVALHEAYLVVRSESPAMNRQVAVAAVTLVLVLWTTRVPLLSDPLVHDRIVDYSGYGASAFAVLRIARSLEPYTWTLVSYGQEFPMVLRRGFHVSASDFLERYDPHDRILPIPTPEVFLIVEKKPHPFQINAWASRFSRAELQQRLQTWLHLYQASHTNISVLLEDENVRVYQIRRSEQELEQLERDRRAGR